MSNMPQSHDMKTNKLLDVSDKKNPARTLAQITVENLCFCVVINSGSCYDNQKSAKSIMGRDTHHVDCEKFP